MTPQLVNFVALEIFLDFDSVNAYIFPGVWRKTIIKNSRLNKALRRH
jgi:hypothetical protein